MFILEIKIFYSPQKNLYHAFFANAFKFYIIYSKYSFTLKFSTVSNK